MTGARYGSGGEAVVAAVDLTVFERCFVGGVAAFAVVGSLVAEVDLCWMQHFGRWSVFA